MEIKILQVFYGSDGLPYKDKERKVHFPIVGSGFQGASQTTKIRFYFGELGDSGTTWVATAKLPNGKLGSKILSPAFDSTLQEYYAELSLSSFYFQYKGDVFFTLQGYDGGITYTYDSVTELYTITGTPVIQSSGSIKMTVNYATQFVGSGEEENTTIQDILALVGTKVTKTDVPNILYGTNGGGSQTTIPYTQGAIGNTVPLRSSSGQISVPTEPVANTDAASKSYADRTNYLLDAIYYDDAWFVGRNTLYIEPQNNASLVVNTANQPSYILNNKKDIVIANDYTSENNDEDGVVLFNGIKIHSADQYTTQDIIIRSENSTTTRGSKVDVSPDGLQLESSSQIYVESPLINVYMDTDSDFSVGSIHVDLREYEGDEYTTSFYNVYVDNTATVKNSLSINGFNEISLLAEERMILDSNGMEIDGGTNGIMFSAGQTLYPEVDGAAAGDEVDIGRANARFRNIYGINLYGDTARLDNSTLIDENDNTIYFGQTNTSNQFYVMATQDYVMDYVASQLGGIYKPQGSASVSELNSMTKTQTMNGYVYNVTNSGTLTNYDSSTLSVNQGDNVVFLWKNGTWEWDDLAGLVDLSDYYTKTESDNRYVGLTGNQLVAGDKKFTGTNYFYNICLPQNVNSPNESSLILRRSSNNPTWDLEGKDYHGDGNNILTLSETNVLMRSDLLFYSNNTNDIGSSSAKVKDIYVAGSLKDGTNSVSIDKIVTTNTDQTISGVKTFSNGYSSNLNKIQNETTFTLQESGGRTIVQANRDSVRINANLLPSYNQNWNLGLNSSAYMWQNGYFAGQVYAQNTFNVINASDITNNTLTQAQYDLITNGKPTLIKGTLFYYNNAIYIQAGQSGDLIFGSFYSANGVGAYKLSTATREISRWSSSEPRLALTSISQINGYTLDFYRNNILVYATNSTTTLKYGTVNNISISADTTFTFEAAPVNCYGEYIAFITNTDSSTITLTFTGVTNILCNDDSCVVTNGTNSTITLPTGVTIEVNVVNNKMVAINFEAQ